MSLRHNGNQDRVLRAVRHGHSTLRQIQRATGIDQNAVWNALRRLRDLNLVFTTERGHHVPVVHIYSTAIFDAWSGVPRLTPDEAGRP